WIYSGVEWRQQFLLVYAGFGTHAALPPFPTRRSSDLSRVARLSPRHDRVEQAIMTIHIAVAGASGRMGRMLIEAVLDAPDAKLVDRKSTRLNSSHVKISYAVFCLKKKKGTNSSLNFTT